jgi:hypothetical protein
MEKRNEAVEAFERLAAAARLQGDDRTTKLALRSIERIKRGEVSTSSQYHLPDVY